MQAEGEVVRLQEAAGQPRDFRTLYEGEHRRLFQALSLVTGDRHDAADLMHEAFLNMWERWGSIEGGVVHDPFDEVELREDVRQMLHMLTPHQRAALLLLDLYDDGSEEAGWDGQPSIHRPRSRDARHGRAPRDRRRPICLTLRRSSRW